MTAVAILHRESILQRLANGEYSTQISESLGMERSTVSQVMRNDPEYQSARESGMECRLDAALASIVAAGDNLNLARAREIVARRIEWRAEREFGDRWGQKSNLKIENVTGLADKLRRARERVIELEPEPVLQREDASQSQLDDKA